MRSSDSRRLPVRGIWSGRTRVIRSVVALYSDHDEAHKLPSMAERMSALSCLRSRSTVALKRRPNSPIAIARLDVGAQMLSLIDLKSRTVCQRVVFGGCTCGKITDFVPANSIVSENSIMCKAGLPNQFKDSVSRTRNCTQHVLCSAILTAWATSY